MDGKTQVKTGLTIREAVADFLEFVKTKRRPNTYKRYRAILEHFRESIRADSDVSALTPADIDAFRDYRLGKKNPFGEAITPRNVNYEMATIRAFYYWLQRFRCAELSNPAAKVKPLAVTRTLVDVYEEEELERFFNACAPEERAIFKAFYYTGLRDQELAHFSVLMTARTLVFHVADVERQNLSVARSGVP
ncbi:MAG: site-specific integrase [Acidobacteria bacterium]|nr:site-specific integrase [Acidobacteriota bacterium]